MGIIVSWDDDAKSILRFDYYGKRDWKTFAVAHRQSLRMVEGIVYRLDVIHNVTSPNRIPENSMASVRREILRIPPNVVLNIMASEYVHAHTLMDMIRTIYADTDRNWYAVRTLDEARTLIAQDRMKSRSRA